MASISACSPPDEVRKTYFLHPRKRARLIPPCSGDDSQSGSWRDWESLACGPAWLITERVIARDVADYIRFRAVCSTWRRCSAAEPRGALDRWFHPRQWIMLPECHTVGATRRRFLNLSTGECIRVELPELTGLAVLAPTSEGLLVLLDEETDAVCLLNPLTRFRTELPPATELLAESEYEYERRVYRRPKAEILAAYGAGLTGEDSSTVVLSFPKFDFLAVTRPGDARWTKVAPPDGIRVGPILSLAGRVYCATDSRFVMALETPSSQPPQLVKVAEINWSVSHYCIDTVHLVDSGGELVALHRQLEPRTDRIWLTYDAYRVDLAAGKTRRVRSFRGRSAFIGHRLALSVPAGVFPAITRNSIYVGSDCDEKYAYGQWLELTPMESEMGGRSSTPTWANIHYTRPGLSTASPAILAAAEL